MKYTVTMVVKDNGKSTMWVDSVMDAHIYLVVPFKSTSKSDVYVDIFDTLKDAHQFYDDNKEVA